MKLTIVKTYHVNISTEVEVPDEDYEAGLDYEELVEKSEDELELPENISEADVSEDTSVSVLNEEGDEVFFDN